MAFSYTPGGTDSVSKVRLLIGDTAETTDTPALFQDEEIELLVTLEGTVDAAAAAAAKALAFRFAKEVDKWVGDLKILASQKAERFQKLYESLVANGSNLPLTAIPTAGGVYKAEKDAYEANTALVQPYLKRGIHDNRT